ANSGEILRRPSGQPCLRKSAALIRISRRGSLMKATQFMSLFALAALATACSIQSANAAFMVESRATAALGKGFGNFSLGGDNTAVATSTATSAAVGGTAAIGSIFGGNGSVVDTYVYSYKPGTNADNTTYAAGAVLGSTTG